MSRYVFSFYDGSDLVLYDESDQDESDTIDEEGFSNDSSYLEFFKSCQKMIHEYKKGNHPKMLHGDIFDNYLCEVVKSWC